RAGAGAILPSDGDHGALRGAARGAARDVRDRARPAGAGRPGRPGGSGLVSPGGGAGRAERLGRRRPRGVWGPSLRAFGHTRPGPGADGADVEKDLAEAIRAGDGADDDPAVAAFCAAYFDLAASEFPVELDARGNWQRVEEWARTSPARAFGRTSAGPPRS